MTDKNFNGNKINAYYMLYIQQGVTVHNIRTDGTEDHQTSECRSEDEH